MRDPRLNLGDLLEQAIRHRLLCRLAALLADPKWDEILPTAVHFHLMESRLVNEHRVRALRSAAVEVAEVLSRETIPFVFTKGIVLESTVYRGEWTRRLGDIDVMVHERDLRRVEAALRACGFKTGTYDWLSRRVLPLGRKEEVRYAMSPDHLPHFYREVDDAVVPYIKVDVSCSMTWHRSDWQIPSEAVLAVTDRFTINGVDCPRMTWPLTFLFTVLHVFREAWFEDNIGDGLDVTLAALADVFLLWRDHQESIVDALLQSYLSTYGLQRPVAWVAAHVDRTLGSRILEELDLARFADNTWLRSLRAVSGGLVSYAGNMRERLQARDRRLGIGAARRDD